MKIYIAAPWISREDMFEVAKSLEDAGHEITHAWWETKDRPVDSPGYDMFLRWCAVADVAGAVAADALFVVNSAKSEGKAVEQGIGIAQNKPIVIVGKRGEHSVNVFHYLPNYHWVDNIQDGIQKLQEL